MNAQVINFPDRLQARENPVASDIKTCLREQLGIADEESLERLARMIVEALNRAPSLPSARD
jgi:hypothetical protein